MAKKKRNHPKVSQIRPSPFVTYEVVSTQSLMRTLLHKMNFGVERRELILRYLREYGTLYINRKYCLIEKYDTDLQNLIKKGLVRKTRDRSLDHSRTTRIVLV